MDPFPKGSIRLYDKTSALGKTASFPPFIFIHIMYVSKKG